MNIQIGSDIKTIINTKQSKSISKMDSIEHKQQYLRQMILDQNYDANQFMDYCESSIGNTSIDTWSFAQLVKIVQDFIQSVNTGSNGQVQIVGGKVGLDAASDFQNWDMHMQTQSQNKNNQPKFQLNLLDLDFLDGMSGNKGAKAVAATAVTAVTSGSLGTSPKKGEQNNKGNYMSVPADVAKKLQQGNDSFIVGYNPAYLQAQTQKQVKVEKSVNNNYNNYYPQEQRKPTATEYVPNQTTQVGQVGQIDCLSKVMNCKKIVNKSRLQGHEEVAISGHEIINPNVFVPKYVLYFITVNPQNIQVKRRLKDFENLRNLLKKFFPTTQIPHLERSSRLSETQPAAIKKQTLFLESFLNNLIMKRDLKCKLLQQFLFCKDLDLMKKIFKQYEKLPGPKSLQTLFSPTGELNLKMNAQNTKFVNEQISLNAFMQQHFTKMKGLYDSLIAGFQQNVKTISQIQQLHRSFKQRIKNVNSQFTPQYQCPSLQKSIQRVQLMHKQWGVSFKTQARIIQSEIRHLYRYEQDNVNTLNDLLKFQEDITGSYYKRSDKDQANRDQYDNKRLDEFKVSLDAPSKNITVLKHQAAYMQEKVSEECIEYLTDLAKKMDSKFKLFCTLQFGICQDMESVWSHFQKYYK